jgi:hypothetical protein
MLKDVRITLGRYPFSLTLTVNKVYVLPGDITYDLLLGRKCLEAAKANVSFNKGCMEVRNTWGYRIEIPMGGAGACGRSGAPATPMYHVPTFQPHLNTDMDTGLRCKHTAYKVPFSINGMQLGMAIIDTGATKTSLSSRLLHASGLGSKVIPSAFPPMNVAGHSSASAGKLKSVTLTVGSAPACVTLQLDVEVASAKARYDMLLGCDFPKAVGAEVHIDAGYLIATDFTNWAVKIPFDTQLCQICRLQQQRVQPAAH